MNEVKLENFFINSGMKQDCALSMILYVLSIEELIVRVKLNEKMKRFKWSVLKKLVQKSVGMPMIGMGY